MSVGKRIRALRAKNKVGSQEELAYLVGTARQTISLWERDVCLPEGANLLKLAKVLNTSVAYIMGETPTPESSEPEAGAPRPGRDGVKTAYSLSAASPEPLFISMEKSANGKTVRYELPPDCAERVFPFVERLWQKIEKEMEARG
ncbi:MAG TPA: helix-turn-helix transcriptional regulator [Candidatus Caccocola faecipullorum]|nr:helix-turn-helix transcriptional regulator [Candidatus Caccocola faecipullorum]